jgi:4-amino-4-deoxy-L-arabinose transferase-like glycosyltransferase
MKAEVRPMENTTHTAPSSGIIGLCKSNWRTTSTFFATLLAGVVLLTLLGHKPLTNWDEGIYAEISREMLSGSVLVPHWNYQPWFEKPPLMLWITAAFFKLFGVHEFWARAGSALSGVAIVALLHAWLLRRNDILAAWISTLILLTTFGFLHVCRVGEMDVLLSLGCCIAIIGLVAIQNHKPTGWYLFWCGLAIALMTKGAASITLILAAIIFSVIERWKLTRLGRHFWLALSLCLLLVLPWHLYMFHRFGTTFLADYLGLHVLARATHQIEDHITHWWFYLWVLLISAAPFVLLYPFAIFQGVRRKELRAWAIFALVVLCFFTVVKTRLPHYIAPIYPALAVLTAVFLADALRDLQAKRQQSPKTFCLSVSAITAAICIVSALLTSSPRRKLHQAKVGPDIVNAEKESIQLLRNVFSHPQSISGPLLTWWEGDERSIATSVFYATRPVQQIVLKPTPINVATDKYLFQPQPLSDALASQPRIILLDKYLIPQIPTQFSYHPIVSGRSMEVGTITRK